MFAMLLPRGATPAPEEMLTMRPWPWAFINGATALMQLNVPVRKDEDAIETW